MIIFNAALKKYLFSCDGCLKVISIWENLKLLALEIDEVRSRNKMLTDWNFKFEKDYCHACRTKLFQNLPIGAQFEITVIHDYYEEIGINAGDRLLCLKQTKNDVRTIEYKQYQIDLENRTVTTLSNESIESDGRVIVHSKGR